MNPENPMGASLIDIARTISHFPHAMFRWFTSNIHICIVSSLVLAIGVYGTVVMIVSLLLGEPKFDFAFLLISIGLGLLRGSSLQRGLFGAILAFGVVGLVIISLITIWSGFSGGGNSNDPTGSWVGFFLVSGFFVYAFLVLGSAKNDSWFSQKYSGKAPPYIIPVTVVLAAFFGLSNSVAKYERDCALAQVFPYDLEVRVIDSKTGKNLRSVSLGRSDVDFEGLEVPNWMKGNSVSGPDHKGSAGNISGFARRSFIVTIESEGYVGESIKVDRYTTSPLEVSLQPLAMK